MTLFLSLAGSLVLTLLIELAAALGWRVPRGDFALVVLANLLTNPAVVLCHALAVLWLPAGLLPVVTFVLEAAAITAEGWLYSTRSAIRAPWEFAVAANLLSFVIGLLL